MTSPVCACHSQPMRWNKDPRYRRGGFWKCRVSDLEQRRARYATDPEARLIKQLQNMSRIRVVN